MNYRSPIWDAAYRRYTRLSTPLTEIVDAICRKEGLKGTHAEQGSKLDSYIDRAEAEIERQERASVVLVGDTMALEYEDAITGAELIRNMEGE